LLALLVRLLVGAAAAGGRDQPVMPNRSVVWFWLIWRRWTSCNPFSLSWFCVDIDISVPFPPRLAKQNFLPDPKRNFASCRDTKRQLLDNNTFAAIYCTKIYGIDGISR